MAFAFPEDARPWNEGRMDVEHNGVVVRQFIYRDPGTRLGRVFWTDDSRRIFLVGPRYNNWPVLIVLDGEPVERPRNLLVIEDAVRFVVDLMQRIDGYHDNLEESPDGEP